MKLSVIFKDLGGLTEFFKKALAFLMNKVDWYFIAYIIKVFLSLFIAVVAK